MITGRFGFVFEKNNRTMKPRDHREVIVFKKFFLQNITAQILARSLANFYRQYADRHMNL